MEIYNNVILFGAGASYDAGIPLMNNFVDCMWEYAMRGKVGNTPIPEHQLKTLVEANNIRKELSSYQSRAYFDDRNLEDILSLLSFELFGGDTVWKQRYDTIVEAIRDTIELSCNLKFETQTPPRPYTEGNLNHYLQFWSALFSEKLEGHLPAIVTFNYDLVFERSLWQFFHRKRDSKAVSHPRSVTLEYYYDKIKPFRIKAINHFYYTSGENEKDYDGVKAEFDFSDQASSEFTVPYLKLHGSLNWTASSSLEPVTEIGNPLLKASSNPLILPPVFNKLNDMQTKQVWSKALSIRNLR